MSGRGYIAAESDDQRCELCGKTAETRPYGPHNEEICFQCGMKDEATTKRKFNAYVFGEHSA